MRHPMEEFVKAEIAYRADPWNPGLRDDPTGGSRRPGRRSRRRRNRSRGTVPGRRPGSELASASAAEGATAYPASVRPFPAAPSRPDAA
jgi:hypothetical protein